MIEHKTFEEVEIDGRSFIIHMMPAQISMAILKELASRSLPVDLFSMFSIGEINVGQKLKEYGLGNSSNVMPMDEFIELEMKLLKYVDERLPGNDVQVVDELGNYQVQNLEYNLDLFSSLILKVLGVNYKDFFINKLKKLGLMLKDKDEVNQDQLQDLVQSLVG